MEDSLKKRYSIKLLANIISGVVGAFIVAIVPKTLGPIAYGQFIYLQDFFTKLIGFLDMGSSIALFTKLSAKQTRKELLSFYFLYSIIILLIVVVFIFLMNSFNFTQNIMPNIEQKYIYMGIFFGFFTWLTQVFIQISDAYALTVSVELIKITHKLFSLLLLMYFVSLIAFDLEKYFLYIFIVLVSFLLVLTLLFIKKGIFQKSLFNLSFDIKSIIHEFLAYCSPLVVFNIIAMGVGIFDIWLLQKTSGSEETGFYGLAYSIAAMSFLFSGAMTPIITREFSRAFGQKDLKKMRKLFYRYVPMLYSIASFFGVFISIQSENVLAIFTDETFTGAYWALVVMAYYPIHQTYGQLSGSIFYATEQTKLYKNIGIISMGIGLFFSFLLIYVFTLGALGLVLKMVIVQFIAVNIQLYYNSKLLNFSMRYFVTHQFYSILFFVILSLVSSSLFNFVDNAYIQFFFSGFLYTFFVIISTYFFPQIFTLTREELLINMAKVFNKFKK